MINDDYTKIKSAFEYANQNVFNALNDNNYERTNGTIYINHEYINKIRKVMYAFENADYEKRILILLIIHLSMTLMIPGEQI